MHFLIPLFLVVLVTACSPTAPMKSNTTASSASAIHSTDESVEIIPISHATMVLRLETVVVYTDPVGGKEIFSAQASPDIILLTDIHGDHFSLDTLEAITVSSTRIVAPKVVYDALSPALQEKTTILQNTEVIVEQGVSIEAIAMYNIPEKEDAFHTKGRGNGYVLEHKGTRIYISGDTSNTPEMRALQNIDIAFVCMNLPYTMDAAEAAAAVLAFAPTKVYPYHYRQPNGFADIETFTQLVTTGNPAIEVVQLEWYKQ